MSTLSTPRKPPKRVASGAQTILIYRIYNIYNNQKHDNNSWKTTVFLDSRGNMDEKVSNDKDTGRSIRCFSDLLVISQNDEDQETLTSINQEETEARILRLFMIGSEPILNRERHVEFLKSSLVRMPEAYECLDCSRPWLCYWSLLALRVLGERLTEIENGRIVEFLRRCQDPEGGFGGGPGQYPHLASTYAAVCALAIIETDEALEAIDRQGLYNFFKKLKSEDGSFAMHVDGETDLRGAYCALAVAKLTNIDTTELFNGTDDWIVQCQTWEGGFGGSPGMEAHGGYTYCGLASLVLLGKQEKCNMSQLLRWLVNKQMRLEGGFQGRTNKLVDACYSFWQGASFPIIHALLSKDNTSPNDDGWLFDQKVLQEYILICCQHYNGGLIDKPGKNRDVYHSCYALSGLSIAQNSSKAVIIGRKEVNLVEPVHPLYNMPFSAVSKAMNHFTKLPITN